MAGRWRGGCVWLLALPLAIVLLTVALASVGILVGLRQPDHVWAVPMRRGYFAIGMIVNSADCRRLRARGFNCSEQYGAVLYMPGVGPGGYGIEYTLFSIPQPWEAP